MQFKYWLQRQLSRFTPITLHVFESENSGELQVVWYKMQMCLATANAFYSYGIRYAPFNIAFKHLKSTNNLPKPTDQMLMLGGALCSAQQILHYKYNITLAHTVVEHDAEIIDVAERYLPIEIQSQIKFVLDDAFEFIFDTKKTWDIIAVDIFNDLTIPQPFCEPIFLSQCKKVLNANGVFIMNTHFLMEENKQLFTKALKIVFPNAIIIPYEKNEIVIAQKIE
jgi:spermidine synthase